MQRNWKISICNSIFAIFIILVTNLCYVNHVFSVTPPDLGNECYYNPINDFDDPGSDDDEWFECTRYAFGRACEKTGTKIEFSTDRDRHGGRWCDIVEDLHIGQYPQTNSIAVWSNGAWDDGNYGHVAFVEEVDENGITISEANWSDPVDGEYNGFRTFDRPSELETRGSYELVGYIYIDVGLFPDDNDESASWRNRWEDEISQKFIDAYKRNGGSHELGIPAVHQEGGDRWVGPYDYIFAENTCKRVYVQDFYHDKNGYFTIVYNPYDDHDKAYLMQGCLGYLWWEYQHFLGAPQSDEEEVTSEYPEEIRKEYEIVQKFETGEMYWDADKGHVLVKCDLGDCKQENYEDHAAEMCIPNNSQSTATYEDKTVKVKSSYQRCSEYTFPDSWVSVSNGINISPTTVTLGQDFTINFTLEEQFGQSKTFEKIAVAILNPNGTHAFDFETWDNVNVPGGSNWTQTATNHLYDTRLPGSYKAVVRGKLPDGEWFDFDTVGTGVNPKEFDATDEGGGELPDLIVRDLYIEDHETAFHPGEDITIYTRVKNIGEADVDVDQDIRIEYFLSDGLKIDSDPVYIGHDDIPSEELTAGHSGYESYHTEAPDEFGTYNITVEADTEEIVEEEHTSNNDYEPPLVFEVVSPPVLSVKKNDINLGNNENGSAFTTSIQITNDGDELLEGSLSENADWLDIVSDPNFALAANETKTINLSGNFPSDNGFFETVVSITSNGGDEEVNIHGVSEIFVYWTLDESPYTINNERIEYAYRLIIEPGVEIKFESENVLQVDGTLVARGTKDQPIVFTSAQSEPSPGDWGRIFFSDNSTDAVFDEDGNYLNGSILEHCRIEYGGGPDGMVYVDKSSPFINLNNIQYSDTNGVHVNYGSSKITNNDISGNRGRGVYHDSHGNDPKLVKLIDNFIALNETGGVYITSGRVENNIIVDNNGTGISGDNEPYTGSFQITKNMINNNLGYGIDITGDSNIMDNIIIDNAHGVKIKNSFLGTNGWESQTITNNITSGNGCGLSGLVGNAIIFENSIINNVLDDGFAVKLSGGTGLFTNTTQFKENTISYNTSGKSTIQIDGKPLLNNNNLLNNDASYYVFNTNEAGTPSVNAESNWWGTADEQLIQARIYDWSDDGSKGVVDYEPYLTELNVNAPISPPAGFTASLNGNNADLEWSPNHESDVAGYFVHWDTDDEYPYANAVDVGNVTSYTLEGLDSGEGYYIAVTAYDADYNPTADDPDTVVDENKTSGHESWFATHDLSRTVSIILSASPESGGTVQGDGNYQIGQETTVEAIPADYYSFVNWTEDGTQVSPSVEYTFTVNSDRDLVANFALTGSLQVFIQPPEAAEAGAQWRRVGTSTWYYSGEEETDVPVGEYEIEFKPAPGWQPEGTIEVQVQEEETATATTSYVEQDAALSGVMMLLLEE